MYIDMHVHTIRTASVTRANGETYATPEQLIEMMDRAGIDRAVLLPEVSPECGHHFGSPEEMLAIAQEFPRFIPFCNVDPRIDTNGPDADLKRIIAYYLDKGCKGLGEITANLSIRDPRVYNLFGACQELGIPVIFHIGPRMGGYYGLVDEPGLPGLEAALKSFPDLLFLGHS